MDVVLLSRIQFAFTIAFHYIFPPLSIGLGIFLVIMEGTYLKTKKKLYEQMTRFWVRIFALTFAMGVASGIVMEFQFGTNWSAYSRFVGDVFGSALAAEGVFAFFLESGFLAILVFGWNRVGPKVHFLATILVAFGSIFSAVWIVIANSWQQTPAGYHLVGEGSNVRAEITDFWQLVFNPSSMERLSHVLSGCWLAGATLVMSVSAYYLIKNKHVEFAKASLKIGIAVAAVASLLQLATGHLSADGVAENQPAKLAAFEGHYEASAPGDMYLFGWVDESAEQVKHGVRIPGMLSWLVHFDSSEPVTGLRSFAEEDRPPVNAVFQSYHLMIVIGMALIAISFGAAFFLWRGRLYGMKWFLWILVFTVLLPQAANQLGWLSAELGRQPWAVYNLLRTSDAVSPILSEQQAWFSLIMFVLVYALLFALFIFLLDNKIRTGPTGLEDETSTYEYTKRGVESLPLDGRKDGT
jgi:cytochrome d ubiquinol oxidase subunit I